jgi:hypothetical protein
MDNELLDLALQLDRNCAADKAKVEEIKKTLWEAQGVLAETIRESREAWVAVEKAKG